MSARKQPCSNVGHPTGEPSMVVRVTRRAVYAERICPVCNRTQGIARVLS